MRIAQRLARASGHLRAELRLCRGVGCGPEGNRLRGPPPAKDGRSLQTDRCIHEPPGDAAPQRSKQNLAYGRPCPSAARIMPVKVSVLNRPNITSDSRLIGSSGQRSVCVPIPGSLRGRDRFSQMRPQDKRQPQRMRTVLLPSGECHRRPLATRPTDR